MPIFLPPRSTVMRSDMASTSRILWEMKIKPRPSAVICLSTRKRSSTAKAQVIDGDDEDDDEALDGRDEVGRDPDDRLHRCPSDQETAEKVSRQDAPQRVQSAEKRYDDAVEAIVAGEPREAPVGHHPVRDAPEDEYGTGDPAACAAEDHGVHHRALDGHPCVGGCVGRQADGPGTEAEPRTPQENVHGHGHGHGDDDTEVELSTAHQGREPGVLREQLCLGYEASHRERLRLVDHRSREQVVHYLHRHEVEHDRAQDLVDIEVGLEEACDPGPNGTPGGGRDHHQRDEQERRQSRHGEDGGRRGQRAHDDLALTTYVPDVGPDGDADPGCYEKERDSFLGGAGESVAAPKGAREQGMVPGDRVRSESEYEQRPNEQCCERREGQGQPAQDQLAPG